MDPDLKNVSSHMRELGLVILGRAVYSVTFSEMMAPFAHAMAVNMAAHGAEIALKSIIAKEHPLLIFEHIPSSKKEKLSFEDLLEKGRTLSFLELPNRIWATTGYRMGGLEGYKDFQKLRNAIVHFAVPEHDYSKIVLKFVFEIIDPVINHFWSDSVINHVDKYDEVTSEYLPEQLTENDVKLTEFANEALEELRKEH